MVSLAEFVSLVTFFVLVLIGGMIILALSFLTVWYKLKGDKGEYVMHRNALFVLTPFFGDENEV